MNSKNAKLELANCISVKEISIFPQKNEIDFPKSDDDLYPPLGMRYVWGRYSIMGETDHANILRLWSKGYKPVPPERHPNTYSDRSVSGFISRKGSVLLEISERDTAIHNSRLDYINSEIDKNPGLAIEIKRNREHYVKELNAPVTLEIEIN
jgi:hypothetical protein